MRVLVLEEATIDLADGYRFYERQANGLGEYFLDSLWSEKRNASADFNVN
jgi:hypothetical protein